MDDIKIWYETDLAILDKYNIPYQQLPLTTIIFNIELYLNNHELDPDQFKELDTLESNLQEKQYYQNTNK